MTTEKEYKRFLFFPRYSSNIKVLRSDSKTKGFLTFSGVIEMENRTQMSKDKKLNKNAYFCVIYC